MVFLYILEGAIIGLIFLIIFYLNQKNKYWTRNGLPTIKEKPLLFFGNSKNVLFGGISMSDRLVEIYNEAKERHLQHIGFNSMLRPIYVPVDLDILKNIMVGDFQHFVNRGIIPNEKVDPLRGHLVNLTGARWRSLRSKLTPTFTSGKMKLMFQKMLDCSAGLTHLVSNSKNAPIDVKELFGRFTIDIIGSVVFGIECNSLSNSESEFYSYSQRVFMNTKLERFYIAIKRSLPGFVLKLFKIKFTKPDVERFFIDIVTQTVKYRKEFDVYQKDFMQLLIEIGKNDENERLTINEIAAQAYVFFLAGYETSSTTMTYSLFELAQNPEIQSKLRLEIETVLAKHDGKLSYEAFQEMCYLDKVLQETLRKHPPIPFVPRACNLDYKISDEIVLKKGTIVMIPIRGIHRDADYYPDPEKFDPDRFNEENKAKRHHFAWIPFGEGPRICIGLRFGLLKSKVGLVSLLRDFSFELNSKTKLPLKQSIDSLFTSADGGIWLNAKPIK